MPNTIEVFTKGERSRLQRVYEQLGALLNGRPRRRRRKAAKRAKATAKAPAPAKGGKKYPTTTESEE